METVIFVVVFENGYPTRGRGADMLIDAIEKVFPGALVGLTCRLDYGFVEIDGHSPWGRVALEHGTGAKDGFVGWFKVPP